MESSHKLKIGAVQMNSTDNVDENLEKIEQWIVYANQRGVKLLVLPENFACFSAKTAIAELVDTGDDAKKVRLFLSDLAKRFQIWIVAGTLPLKTAWASNSTEVSEHRVYASSLLFDDLGREVARYDKWHLFDVDVGDRYSQYRESKTFIPGSQTVVTQTPVGRLGLSVCYDLRFPELYRMLMQQNMELISVPAAFTQVTGAAHWDVLLRSRAIENQCYVIAANQVGNHSGQRQTFGHSQIIDPWGKVLSILKSDEGCVMAEVDFSYLQRIRLAMPALHHRRL